MINIVNLISNSYDLVRHSEKTLRSREHDSLIVWPERNVFSWYSRNIYGGPEKWISDVLGIVDIEDFITHYQQEQLDTDVYESRLVFDIVTQYPIGSKKYNAYMQSRNITKETAQFFGLEDFNGNTIIPLYNNFGYRCGSLLRRMDTNVNFLKYRKLINDELCNLWPYRLLQEASNEKPVLVFEGAWSAMRFYQVSNGEVITLALLGTNANRTTCELLNGLNNVVFLLDNDKNKAGDSVKERLKQQRMFNKNWRFIKTDIYPDELNDIQIEYTINYIKNGNIRQGVGKRK